jgi:hypothetical protein
MTSVFARCKATNRWASMVSFGSATSGGFYGDHVEPRPARVLRALRRQLDRVGRDEPPAPSHWKERHSARFELNWRPLWRARNSPRARSQLTLRERPRTALPLTRPQAFPLPAHREAENSNATSAKYQRPPAAKGSEDPLDSRAGSRAACFVRIGMDESSDAELPKYRGPPAAKGSGAHLDTRGRRPWPRPWRGAPRCRVTSGPRCPRQWESTSPTPDAMRPARAPRCPAMPCAHLVAPLCPARTSLPRHALRAPRCPASVPRVLHCCVPKTRNARSS